MKSIIHEEKIYVKMISRKKKIFFHSKILTAAFSLFSLVICTPCTLLFAYGFFMLTIIYTIYEQKIEKVCPLYNLDCAVLINRL